MNKKHIQAILKAYHDGEKIDFICSKFNISSTTLGRIRKKEGVPCRVKTNEDQRNWKAGYFKVKNTLQVWHKQERFKKSPELTKEERDAEYSRFIAVNGVTKCPTMFVGDIL